MKKELLKTVLDFISVDYDHQEKIHRLYIHFKLPVFQHGNGVEIGNQLNYVISKRQETLGNRLDQKTPLTFHSTVVGSSPTVSPYNSTTSYSLRMSVELKSSNLWVSPYSEYQKELFSLICKLHDDDGMDFQKVSDWLNDNGYKTSRGKVFKENHVWSIYQKKKKSIERFSREYDHTVIDMKVDGVDDRPEVD